MNSDQKNLGLIDKIRNNTPLFLKLILIVFLTLPIHYLSGKLIVNVSPSLNVRTLWLIDGEVKANDYVVFDFEHQLVPEGLTRMSKRVGCMHPSYIDIIVNDYFCDGNHLGTALEMDKDGNAMPRYLTKGQIPIGEAFVVGDHERSFDSRYYGLLKVSVLRRATTLFGGIDG